MRQIRREHSGYSSQMPKVVIGQAITINCKGKKIPGKVTSFSNKNRLIEATANGKKYLGERSGKELTASLVN